MTLVWYTFYLNGKWDYLFIKLMQIYHRWIDQSGKKLELLKQVVRNSITTLAYIKNGLQVENLLFDLD